MIKNLEKIYKALADRNRLRILKMLEVRPLCVCEITHVMGIAQPSVSRHLAILRDAELVGGIKNGQWTSYSLSASTDDTVATIITSLRRWGNDDPQVAADRAQLPGARREILCGKA